MLRFSIIKITPFFIIGILLGSYFSINFTYLITVILLLLASIALILIKQNDASRKWIWVDITIFSFIVSVGVLTAYVHNDTHLQTHYTHIKTGVNQEKKTRFKVFKTLKSTAYYDKFIVQLLEINEVPVSGKILLNIKKDSLNSNINVDNIFTVKRALKPIIKALNPHQFDYSRYLKKQYIYNQLYVESSDLKLIDSTTSSVYGFASKLRQLINKKLKYYGFQVQELSIINALLLGQRQDISKDLYNNYAKAGAIHILAVSGLHVGIILLLLQYSLQFLTVLKHGKKIRLLLILILLWSFAFIAGLSASVFRAVMMFSVFAVSLNLKRPHNIYNSIFISAFFILILKPNFLFDVGFQLSYAAVIAIVSLQPLIKALWRSKYAIVTFFWDIFTVTLAAQIGVLPLSLYYFHQFPGLFFISNLVIIPCLGFILGFGILIILLALVNALPEIFVLLYTKIIAFLNYFVTWISHQESFVFKNIPFEGVDMLLCYSIILASLYLIYKKSFKSILIIGLFIVSFQVFQFYKYYKNSFNKTVIFHKSKKTLIGQKQNKTLYLYHNLDSLNLSNNTMISNYMREEGIVSIYSKTLTSVYKINNNNLLRIDSLGIYKLKKIKPDIILLTQSPKVNLNRLIDLLQPKLIISDGSNFKTYENRWLKTCESKGIPYHQTNKEGAFIINWNSTE